MTCLIRSFTALVDTVIAGLHREAGGERLFRSSVCECVLIPFPTISKGGGISRAYYITGEKLNLGPVYYI